MNEQTNEQTTEDGKTRPQETRDGMRALGILLLAAVIGGAALIVWVLLQAVR